jgi:hypothetical protein
MDSTRKHRVRARSYRYGATPSRRVELPTKGGGNAAIAVRRLNAELAIVVSFHNTALAIQRE